jgi:hypothetical protein
MNREHDQAQAFDFQMGHWRVRHRRLKTRLCSADDWEEFEGTANVRPVLGGLGNVEDQEICLPGGTYHAIAVRSFDIVSGMWAIWWLDGRTPHSLDVPVRGNFESGVGSFYADAVFNQTPVRVRFLWLDTTLPSPRWEQAFSIDGGKTWETNWCMQFSKAASCR